MAVCTYDVCRVQSTLCQLNDLEIDNTSLLRLAEDMKAQVSVLSSRVGELERELGDAQGEISIMSTQLTNGDVDKEAVEEDNRALQLLLEEREQVLSQQETKQSQLEAQLNDLQHNHSVSVCVCVEYHYPYHCVVCYNYLY